jgi:hypothetical protein
MSFSWLAFVLILWAGLLLGVSFIATPVKFMAPNLTMSVALEVGKATFHVFNKVEWVMLALTLLASYLHGPHMLKWWLVGFLAIIMAAETFWLLPALDIRADLVIAGEPAVPGKLHWLYIIADVLKLIALLTGAWWIGKETAP